MMVRCRGYEGILDEIRMKAAWHDICVYDEKMIMGDDCEIEIKSVYETDIEIIKGDG